MDESTDDVITFMSKHLPRAPLLLTTISETKSFMHELLEDCYDLTYDLSYLPCDFVLGSKARKLEIVSPMSPVCKACKLQA